MITLLRSIRQKLLAQNRFIRYLIYAIGEIVLVVIGILIALQINNYNEQQKRIQKEKEVLNLFRESLTIDLKKFDYITAFYDRSKASIRRILDHLENDRPYHDSLAYDFFNTGLCYEQTSFTNGPFETLKSSGIELIRNNELQKKILEVYDDWDPWMESTEKQYVDIILDAGFTLYKTRFDQYWHGEDVDSVITGVMYPLDYEELKKDDEYKYFLKTQLNMMKFRVENPLRDGKLHGGILRGLIEKELGKKIK